MFGIIFVKFYFVLLRIYVFCCVFVDIFDYVIGKYEDRDQVLLVLVKYSVSVGVWGSVFGRSLVFLYFGLDV